MLEELLRAANKAVNSMSYEDILKWWQNKHLVTIDDFTTELENFNIVFAYNSANIENIPVTYHMTRELFCNGRVQNFTGDVSHIMELQNQKFAYEFIAKSLERRTPITKEFVLKVHDIMLRGCYDERRWNKGERPGTFKKNDYCVGASNTGAFPDEVDTLITELINEVNSVDDGDILTRASYFHLVFENIHPFADGNGRVGRVLMNYFLMLNNYPPAVIFNDDKQVYYMALDVYDRTEQISGFKQFLKEETQKTWKHVLKSNKYDRVG